MATSIASFWALATGVRGALVRGGQDLSGGRLAEVAQQPVQGEELMATGGPGVDLGEPAQVAVAVPAEPVVGRAEVHLSQVAGQCLPGGRAVVAGLQGFQEQQPPGDGQDLRGLQVPGDVQRGQAITMPVTRPER